MADRKIVVLNYGPHGVEPVPPSVEVDSGTSITFQKGANTSAADRIRVTFSEPKFFSREVFNEGEDDVLVTSGLQKPTTYECDLMRDGYAQPRIPGSPGGSIEPTKGKGG